METKKAMMYNDVELKEFAVIIQKKLEKAKLQLIELEALMEESEDQEGRVGQKDENDQMAFGKNFVHEMILEQTRYIWDLESALSRVNNKTFGRCTVTGELIDKKRLLSFPTTTTSLAAKLIARPPFNIGQEI